MQRKVVVQPSIPLQIDTEIFIIIFATHLEILMHVFTQSMQQLIIVNMILKIRAVWGLGSSWQGIVVTMQLDCMFMERGVRV